MKLDKRKIGYIIMAVTFLCIFFYEKVADYNIPILWVAAMENGLKSVKVSSEEDIIRTVYIIESSNFDTLSFDDMLKLNENLSEYSKRIKYACNGDVYVCDNKTRSIDKNDIEIYSDYENSQVYQEEQKKEQERATYADKYPYVGMREEFLPYTILGKPDKIEKCRNFEHYRSVRKFKTYTWYETEEHGRWDVTVEYAEWTGSELGYKTYPTSNGIVGYMRYNEKGESPKTVYD